MLVPSMRSTLFSHAAPLCEGECEGEGRSSFSLPYLYGAVFSIHPRGGKREGERDTEQKKHRRGRAIDQPTDSFSLPIRLAGLVESYYLYSTE
jgi:hypothetical protein